MAGSVKPPRLASPKLPTCGPTDDSRPTPSVPDWPVVVGELVAGALAAGPALAGIWNGALPEPPALRVYIGAPQGTPPGPMPPAPGQVPVPTEDSACAC